MEPNLEASEDYETKLEMINLAKLIELKSKHMLPL